MTGHFSNTEDTHVSPPLIAGNDDIRRWIRRRAFEPDAGPSSDSSLDFKGPFVEVSDDDDDNGEEKQKWSVKLREYSTTRTKDYPSMGFEPYLFVHVEDGRRARKFDPVTRTNIRKHAMKKTAAAKKKIKKNPSFGLEIRPPGAQNAPTSSSSSSQPPALVADLGAGRKDPFARYPIEMTDRTHVIMENSKFAAGQ